MQVLFDWQNNNHGRNQETTNGRKLEIENWKSALTLLIFGRENLGRNFVKSHNNEMAEIFASALSPFYENHRCFSTPPFTLRGPPLKKGQTQEKIRLIDQSATDPWVKWNEKLIDPFPSFLNKFLFWGKESEIDGDRVEKFCIWYLLAFISLLSQ